MKHMNYEDVLGKIFQKGITARAKVPWLLRA